MLALSKPGRERPNEIHGYAEMSPRVIQDGSSTVSQDGRQTAQGDQDRGPLACSGLVSGLASPRGDDLTALAEHVAEWADVIDLDVHPVVEDAQAAEAALEVFGK